MSRPPEPRPVGFGGGWALAPTDRTGPRTSEGAAEPDRLLPAEPGRRRRRATRRAPPGRHPTTRSTSQTSPARESDPPAPPERRTPRRRRRSAAPAEGCRGSPVEMMGTFIVSCPSGPGHPKPLLTETRSQPSVASRRSRERTWRILAIWSLTESGVPEPGVRPSGQRC